MMYAFQVKTIWMNVLQCGFHLTMQAAALLADIYFCLDNSSSYLFFFCLDCAVPGWWAPLHAFPFHLIIVLDLNEMLIWELMAAICIAIDPNSKRHAMHTACRDMIYFFFHPSVPHSSSCFCFKYLLSVAISGCGTTCCYCMIMTACLTKQIFNFNPFLAETEFVNGNVVLSHPIK